jgi:hypothetical protein
MEKLVTVSALLPQSAYSRLCLAQPNFAPISALQQYTCIWNTSFVPRHFKYKAHSNSRDLTKGSQLGKETRIERVWNEEGLKFKGEIIVENAENANKSG